MKPYEFKDQIEQLSYEELIKLENVIANKIIVGSNLGAGSKITDAKVSGSMEVVAGQLVSANYVAGVSGWRLTPTSGELNFAVSVDSLDIPDTTTANSFHVEIDGDTFWGCTNAQFTTDPNNAPAYVLKTGVARFTSISLVNAVELAGLVAGTEISIQGWIHTLTFSVTDLDTVAWSAGSIKIMDGTTYAIDAGNTGNMAAETYIYLDIGTSTTVLQTTTTKTNAVGSGKILICVAQNGTDEASFVDFGSKDLNIPGTSIVAGSITANEIAANTITANKLTVSSLDAISADLGAITAGTITLPNTGWIKGGQTDYNTGTGFFLGYSGAAYKFSIGDPTANYLNWDGTYLKIKGVLNPRSVRMEASATLQQSNDAEKTTTSLTYVKLKEIMCNDDYYTLRIKFDLVGYGGNYYANGRIYKNGVAIGTEQLNTTTSYITYSEDLGPFVVGDLIQIYAKRYNTSPDYVKVRNMRFYYDPQMVAIVEFTNQDP